MSVFVANNPWIRGDEKASLRQQKRMTGATAAKSPAYEDGELVRRCQPNNHFAVSSAEEEEQFSASSSSLAEEHYGPGIVKRLRDRFVQLAVARAAIDRVGGGGGGGSDDGLLKRQSFARNKRFASVDDLVESKSLRPVDINLHQQQSPVKLEEGGRETAPSQRIRSFSTHNLDGENEQPTISIADLRRKFESNGDEAVVKKRVAKGKAAFVVPAEPRQHHQQTGVLEFVLKARRLRKVELSVLDGGNPPDPVSASNVSQLEVSYGDKTTEQRNGNGLLCSPVISAGSSVSLNSTPPPDEPVPPAFVPPSCTMTYGNSRSDPRSGKFSETLPTLPKNDRQEGSGMTEVQLLLSKFGQKRQERELFEGYHLNNVDVVVTIGRQEGEQRGVFCSTPNVPNDVENGVIGIGREAFLKGSGQLSDESNSDNGNGGEHVVCSPSLIPLLHSEEIQAQQHHPRHPGSDPYPEEIKALDSLNSEVEDVAGDCNPIRHSLISLVAEEDLALLLEAMQEKFDCELTGEHGIIVGKSNLMIEKKTDKEETEAEVLGEWKPGVEIDHVEYSRIVETATLRDDLQQRRLEMAGFVNGAAKGDETDNSAVFSSANYEMTMFGFGDCKQATALGVTNSWSYRDKLPATVNLSEHCGNSV